MLHRGDPVPHFTIRGIDGSVVSYATDVWQARNLLLVTLPERTTAQFGTYEAALEARREDLAALETKCVVTTEDVPGALRPGVLIADRWGEVYFSVEARDASDLPGADELLDWLRYVQHECPECQGEAK